LRIERPAEPWQVVEGEGQTWIILRSKLTVPHQEITALGPLALDSFISELVESKGERGFYRGRIKLRAYYQSRDYCLAERECLPAVYDEHLAREQLADPVQYPVSVNLPETAASSIFLSRLCEEIPRNVDGKDYTPWQLEIPWQGWLWGGNAGATPKIVFAHLGQVGLETLLCEVLISLAAPGNEKSIPETLASNCFLATDEVVFNLGKPGISKLLGSAVQRAFYQLRPERKAQLTLEYLTKVYLVFVSSQAGGERILVASASIPASLQLSLHQYPSLPLYVKKMESQKLMLALAGERKVVMKEQKLIHLGDGRPDPAEQGSEALAASAAAPAPAASIVAEDLQPVIIRPRPRPGERWQKKKTEGSKSAYCQKKVVAIKFAR